MSMLKNVVVALAALSALTAIPALAQGNAGCKNGKFVGSYTRAAAFPDLWGDGTNVAHTFVYQLNLHSDGTAFQYFSGNPDVMLSSGTGTLQVGSWGCRRDGQLVVTFISAIYGTTTDAKNHPATVPDPPPVDLLLAVHVRDTYLLSVTDADTLTRIQARRRVYNADQDPSNPTGGRLLPVNNNVLEYKRLAASDADLLAP
jgi:hypothetical protein